MAGSPTNANGHVRPASPSAGGSLLAFRALLGRPAALGESLRRYGDILLAALVVGTVAMMIVPLPTPLLDVLLTTNITIAVVLLLVALYVADALAIASFPTILLLTTLFRLALNVSSTRLILLQGYAGEVIQSFGAFVVRGNYVVGAVVFLILTLIQFIVIAKGSERVAEVAARFTLDAMPGKQMSIDADLRAGAIDLAEARRRRRVLGRESQFYGAMDGAMKFVKGDAIAGILITVINILGGLAIGVLQNGMAATDALQRYGLLTIGDGLVAQIPALIISTAAGMVITRVASEESDTSLGSEIGRQILAQPKAVGIAAGLLALLGLVPGLPKAPFFLMAAVAGLVAYALQGRRARGAAEAAGTAKVGELRREAERDRQKTQALLPIVTPIAVEVGSALRAAFEPGGSGAQFLADDVPKLRDALFYDLGVTVPAIRVRTDVPALAPEEYALRLKEVPIARGTIPTGKVLCAESAERLERLGLVAEPATGAPVAGPAAYLPAGEADRARAAGLAVYEAPGIVALHLGRVLRRFAHEFIGIQEVQTMLDALERAYPALVKTVVPRPVTPNVLAEVLERLVEEGVSVRNLRDILEALAGALSFEKDPVALTEHVRVALRRAITYEHSRGSRVLATYVLAPEIEETIRESIQRTPSGNYLALPPEVSRDVVAAVRREVSAAAAGAPPAVIVTQMDIRRYVRRLLEVELPEVAVLSYAELDPEIVVQPIARIGLGPAEPAP